METLLEYLLVIAWDLLKTVVLQWLLTKLQVWWSARKDIATVI
jgi:hypothetical protein